MDRFEEIRKKFPGNNLIPARETPEQKEARRKRHQEDYMLETKVKQGNASEEEINQHFDTEEKGIKDRLQILDYIMEKQKSYMSPEIKKQYDQILERNTQQLDQIRQEREKALNKLLE